ncbi:MAG: L-seryl-tRNA(Sec) selenium transferase [Myxococcaceae bacterium]|nr:L-seryl-tRNA(Sec) selenium transferase [Myxococcaceae bacterium]
MRELGWKRQASWCCSRFSKPVRGAKASWAGSIPVRFRHLMKTDDARLRRLPAVSTLLRRPRVNELVVRDGHAAVVRAVRAVVDAARDGVLRGEDLPDDASFDDAIAARVRDGDASTLLPVWNATGVVLHTNLGRAPLAEAALEAVVAIGRGYSTLEYDLEAGDRGDRRAHAVDLLKALTGAEDALVVNNNAAAILLALTAWARGRGVVVSRGELVEIGGGFRVPDVLVQSGASLVEVGTTNRTHAADYERALDAGAALVLKVHPSNFAIVGYTAGVELRALAKIAHARSVPLFFDAGSGTPDDLAAHLRDGADVVTVSGDKLLGGPQAGIVLGTRRYIDGMRTHPLFRAVRPDKLCLAALEATLRVWRDAPEELPVTRAIALSADEVEARAIAIVGALADADCPLVARVIRTTARVGGGASPLRALDSAAIAMVSDAPDRLLSALREGSRPIVARIEDGAVLLDPRCVPPSDDVAFGAAILDAAQRHAMADHG